MGEVELLPEDVMLRTLTGVPGHGTYESHVTVRAADEATRERFKTLCRELGVKPVLIDLPEGVNPSQPMTSSYHRGTVEEAAAATAGLVRAVRAAGFAVVRVKLEAVATNAGVPTDADAGYLPTDCYFEFHVKLALPPGGDDSRLNDLCRRHDAHLSRNAFKTRADGRAERFVTLRVYHAGKQTAFRRLDRLAAALTAAGFEIVNTQKEYSLFDSHVGLDAGWLGVPPDPGSAAVPAAPGATGAP